MKIYKIFLLVILIITNSRIIADNQKLLNDFHKFGIDKCDQFILENTALKGNWHYFINAYSEEIDPLIKEVSLILIRGTPNDTVKSEYSYIQTPSACYLYMVDTLTSPGPCSSIVNLDYWYVSNELKDRDYTEYKNSGGVRLYAKEITVGNFKACLEEYHIRKIWKLK